ncbi:MAG: DNA recombination-mediator protein A [Candidatus Sericytochromatia bacterium]
MSQSEQAGTLTENKLDTYLEELQLIQARGSKKIAMIGSRHVSFAHQQMIEAMAFALATEGNHIITSGSPGTNFAVIKGVLRANSDNLTVILPQTLEQQPDESREQLLTIKSLVEYPERTTMTLAQASELCNSEIIGKCQQLVAFLYHTSMTLKQTIQYAHEQHKMVTAFYLD